MQIERLEQCPSCCGAQGTRHDRGCSIGRCKEHGQQMAFCLQEEPCIGSVYQGVYPGTLEAVGRGWITDAGLPDINRVSVELTWDPESESYI